MTKDFGYEAGNEADFARLYEENYDRLVAILTTRLRDRVAAEDVVQDAFVKAYKHWPEWRPDAPPGAWLTRIAVNAAASYLRKERIRTIDEVVRRFGLPLFAYEPEHVDRMMLVEELQKLPAKQREAFVLRYVYGMTNREIAKREGVPERTIGSRLYTAREKLAPKFEVEGRVRHVRTDTREHAMRPALDLVALYDAARA